jgi:hypothetical protein
MTPDKWQQCLKTLAELRPKLFQYKEIPNTGLGELIWSVKGVQYSKVYPRQDDIDKMAALLGYRIYVYPANSRDRNLGCEIADLDNQFQWFVETNETSKLEATKEGFMSIVEKL